MPLPPDLAPALDHLSGRIARGQLVVLVGAGASRWAGLPTWKEAVCALARDLAPALRRAVPDADLRFRPPSPDDALSVDAFLKIGEAFRLVCGQERLEERVRALFDSSRVDASDLTVHRLLARLADHVPAIYTTNCDDLLERALAARGKAFQVVAEARDLDDWRFDRIDGRYVARFPVYKLHGSLDRPHTLVLGEADFVRREGLASHPIDLRFCSDVVGREVLLVGYSFSDPNVRWLWNKLRDLDVLPVAHFLEIGASTDLDVAYFLKDRIHRIDLHARDRDRPAELLEFLDALLERCGGGATRPSPRRTRSSRPAASRSGSTRRRASSRPARTSGTRRRSGSR